jgi:hypothetical protein
VDDLVKANAAAASKAAVAASKAAAAADKAAAELAKVRVEDAAQLEKLRAEVETLRAEKLEQLGRCGSEAQRILEAEVALQSAAGLKQFRASRKAAAPAAAQAARVVVRTPTCAHPFGAKATPFGPTFCHGT